jgi:hypothetical protein
MYFPAELIQYTISIHGNSHNVLLEPRIAAIVYNKTQKPDLNT